MNIQENQFAVILRKHAEENGDDSSFFSQKQIYWPNWKWVWNIIINPSTYMLFLKNRLQLANKLKPLRWLSTVYKPMYIPTSIISSKLMFQIPWWGFWSKWFSYHHTSNKFRVEVRVLVFGWHREKRNITFPPLNWRSYQHLQNSCHSKWAKFYVVWLSTCLFVVCYYY